MRHRGPDDNGIVLFSFNKMNWRAIDPSRPNASEKPFEGAVGCNRLKIIDLSENGHQPMIDQERKNIIAFNGPDASGKVRVLVSEVSHDSSES